jgi:hypothetical protein
MIDRLDHGLFFCMHVSQLLRAMQVDTIRRVSETEFANLLPQMQMHQLPQSPRNQLRQL